MEYDMDSGIYRYTTAALSHQHENDVRNFTGVIMNTRIVEVMFEYFKVFPYANMITWKNSVPTLAKLIFTPYRTRFRSTQSNPGSP
jgi:hypothetical protein